MDSMTCTYTRAGNALDSEGLGKLICRGRTPVAPPLLLYVLGAFFFLIGATLIVGTVPMVFSQLRSENNGGLIGVGVGLVIAIVGLLMLKSGRSKPRADRVDFFENGVEIRGGANDGVRCYSEIPNIAVHVIRPAPLNVFKLVVLLLLHLLGVTLVRSRSDGTAVDSFQYLFGGGSVSLSVSDDEQIQVGSIGFRNLESLSSCISRIRGPLAVTIVQA